MADEQTPGFTPGPLRIRIGFVAMNQRNRPAWEVIVCNRKVSEHEVEIDAYKMACSLIEESERELLEALEAIAETLEKLAPCPEQVLDQLAETARKVARKARGW